MISIFAGYVTDLLVGDPHWMPHPVRFIGQLINGLERILLRPDSKRRTKKVCGVGMLLIVMAVVYFITSMMITLAFTISQTLGMVVMTLMVFQIMATKSLKDEAMKVYRPLKEGNMAEARKRISYLVSRDTENMSEEDVTKATVETVSENIVDGIVSPLFFMIFGGVPLAMTYKAVNTLDSMIGYKNEKYLDFGWASARFDDVLNYIPARISSVLILMLCPILKYDFFNAKRILIRDRKNHSSPNSPFSEAAVAGALKIQLGGKASYFGVTSMKPTMGDPIDRIESDHILDSIKIMYGVSVTSLMLFTVVKYIVYAIIY